MWHQRDDQPCLINLHAISLIPSPAVQVPPDSLGIKTQTPINSCHSSVQLSNLAYVASRRLLSCSSARLPLLAISSALLRRHRSHLSVALLVPAADLEHAGRWFCQWRPLFAATIVVSTALSCNQLILIYGLNRRIGIPDLAFAMGDDLIGVVCRMFVHPVYKIFYPYLSEFRGVMQVANQVANQKGCDYICYLHQCHAIGIEVNDERVVHWLALN